MEDFHFDRLLGERYRASVTDEGLAVVITRSFYDYLKNSQAGGRFDRSEKGTLLAQIPVILVEDTVVLQIRLPYIPSPNFQHKKIDWKALWNCSKLASFLFGMLRWTYLEHDEPSFYLSSSPQLMLVEPFFWLDENRPGCGLEAVFCRQVVEKLLEKTEVYTEFPKAEELVLHSYMGLSMATKKEREKWVAVTKEAGFSSMQIQVGVRSCGTPAFLVPGNCACLGNSPDNFAFNQSISSHNVDSPIHQLPMLVGVVAFWEQFLTPFWEANNSN